MGNPKGLRARMAQWCGDTHIRTHYAGTHYAVGVLPIEAAGGLHHIRGRAGSKGQDGHPPILPRIVFHHSFR